MSATVHPLPTTHIPTVKAVAAVALWQPQRFDTSEIAAALSIREGDVERILHVARENCQ